ncbi:hypothetical protein [Enterovibrio norvegicus]|uniref:hypothetical protein n=1 Tax=Enterovibrio norvegicus TaxID=188144 RepID=UPI000C85F84D|nr:hypothetical protein [Enterovibrio norvegicus]PML77493.1 hypothetical protein BCT69_19610 [Enterovibrio norvegicus]
MVIKNSKIAPSIGLALLLSACGGGGDSSVSGGSSGDESDGSIPIAFNLSNASTLVTTEKAFSQNAFKTQMSSVARQENALPTIDFFDFNGSENKKSANSGSGDTNLFALVDDGSLASVVTSDFDANFAFTVKGPDGRFIYAALDWLRLYDSDSLLKETNCAIFKIALDDNAVSCLISGHFAEAPWSSWQKDIGYGGYKPLQFDSQGNVYFLSQEFTVNSNDETAGFEFKTIDYTISQNAKLIRVDPESGNFVNLAPGGDEINSFVVTAKDGLVYRSDSLNMIPDVLAESPKTVQLNGEHPWIDGFYALDDNGTIIYRDNLTEGDDISIARTSEADPGTVQKRNIKSYRPGSRSWSNGVIIGDDGYIYSTYVNYDEDDFTIRRETMQRVLPYAAGELLSVTTSDTEFWDPLIYVVKEKAFYIEEHTDPAFGEYDIVGIQPLNGEPETTLFDDALSDLRLDIEAWELSRDILYFTGLNKANATMITGEIDVEAFSQGRPASEYLTVTDTASVDVDRLVIRDLQLLVDVDEPVNVGSPSIINHVQPKEELYASTIEFNHRMDIDSVLRNLSVTERDASGGYVDDIEIMPIWLGKVVHLIYDISGVSGESLHQPLKFNTNYQIAFSGAGINIDGVPLSLAQSDSDRTFDWSTRIGEGLSVVGADSDEFGFTTGQAINVFGKDVNVTLVDRETTLDHKVSLVTSHNEDWELAFHTSTNEWEGYVKFAYAASIDSLAIRKSSGYAYDDRDWTWEYPQISGSVVRLDADIVDTGDTIVVSLKISDEFGNTYDVTRRVVNIGREYSMNFIFEDDGFGAEYLSILDNIKVTNSEGTTTYIDENFDNYELGSGDYIGGIGLIELQND